MITIVEGVPGSGKTYYSVFKTVDKINRSKYTKINIITNIENFQINDDRVHLTTFETQEELFKILNVDYFKENYTFNYEYNFIIIDECQRYFYKLSNKDVLFFLQYHRHLNCDIFLITQTMRSLPSEIVFLAEFFVEAIPRSFTLNNIFRYNVRDVATKEVIDRFTLPVKSEIFSIYRSAFIENTDRKNFFHQKIFISIAIFTVVILLLLYSFYSIFFSKKQENKQQAQTQKQQAQTQKQQAQTQKQQIKNDFQSQSQSVDDLLKQVRELYSQYQNQKIIDKTDYQMKELSYMQYIYQYRDDIIDLTKNFIIVYDDNNFPVRVYQIEEKKNKQINQEN